MIKQHQPTEIGLTTGGLETGGLKTGGLKTGGLETGALRPPSETGYPKPDRNEQPVFGWPMVVRPATDHQFKGVVKDASTITIKKGYAMGWSGANATIGNPIPVAETDVPASGSGVIWAKFALNNYKIEEYPYIDSGGDTTTPYVYRAAIASFVEYSTSTPTAGSEYTSGAAATNLYVPILEFGQSGGLLVVVAQITQGTIYFQENILG